MNRFTQSLLGRGPLFIVPSWANLLISVFLGLAVAGCGSSEETQEGATTAADPALLQQKVDQLQTANDSLRMQLEKVRQDNRALTARAAELETQLGERASSSPAATSQETPRDTGTATPTVYPLYERGLSLFMGRSFTASIEAFEAMLRAGTPPDLEDNCHYWIGECLYAQKKYAEAIVRFIETVAYAGSDKADDAQIMIAQSYAAMGNKERARIEYQKLIDTYPQSPFVKLAQAKLAKL